MGGRKGTESQRGKGGKWERRGEIMNVLYFAIKKELKRESQELGSETGNARCGRVRGGGEGDRSNLVNASRL